MSERLIWTLPPICSSSGSGNSSSSSGSTFSNAAETSANVASRPVFLKASIFVKCARVVVVRDFSSVSRNASTELSSRLSRLIVISA